MKKIDDSFLTGKCLIASPSMEDERFKNAIIYICSHNIRGAIGFVINKKIPEFSLQDLSQHMHLNNIVGLEDGFVYSGGPMEKIKGFVLHSPDYISENTVPINDGMAVSSSISVIEDIMLGVGPRRSIVVLGYSSWDEKQLEKEIMSNSWLVVDPSDELIFDTKVEEKWNKAIEKLGIEDLSRLSSQVGHA